VYYGDDDEVLSALRQLPLRFLEQRRGTKIDNFLFLLGKHPEIREYEYVLFADEDIEIGNPEIWRLLSVVEEAGADWPQPAHSWSSYVPEWRFLRKKPLLRYELVKFIEIQFFVLSMSTILETLEHWHHFSTGSGLDIFLANWLERRGPRAALVHEVAITHPFRQGELRINHTISMGATLRIDSFAWAAWRGRRHLLWPPAGAAAPAMTS
jgi:hypothetical protein